MTDQLPEWMTEHRLAVLRVVCDTIVPSIQRADDPDGFWARTATDLGADLGVVQALAGLPDEQREGLLGLVDALGALGIQAASQLSREQLLATTALLGPAATAGVAALVNLTLFFSYGLPDPATGKNPMWKTLGYPGPTVIPPRGTKTIVPMVPEQDTELDADVVVVGSGAGGGVIAGRLAQGGLKVVVLEAGGYFDESDFDQIEIAAYQRLYWRGGPQPTADSNFSLQAGATLGGGTTVNWTNCLRTRPWVREEWASEHGLADVAGPEFDRHLDAVSRRISVNDKCSDLNGPNQRLSDAAEALGWSFEVLSRNADPATYQPETAGYLGFGDPTGSKQGTLKTYLQDAYDAGADILVRTRAERVLVEDGRACGVEAVYADPASGATARVLVRASRVVVACGSLESPALLLRSGIGGPEVGKNLRLHPALAAVGTYPTPQKAWWGAGMTGLIPEFEHPENGYGFLIEAPQYTTAAAAAFTPWVGGEAHKSAMASGPSDAWSIALLRDHGSGQVAVDEAGQPVVTYSVTDEIDLANLRTAVDTLIRQHHAAGAVQIRLLAAGLPTWRHGEDLDAFIRRAQDIPFRAGGYRMFSAHQMGTCRMGADPGASVADPRGELHEVKGVWIGDGSAFPTPSGTNPMLSILALADRTADAILRDSQHAPTSPKTDEPEFQEAGQ